MRNLMYGDIDEVEYNLTYLADLTHEELLTATIRICGLIRDLQEEVERLKK